MGRRKSRRKIRLRPKKKIPSIFQCPRCGVTAVSVNIDKKNGVVSVACGACKLRYTFEYEEIFQPVDYYGKFVDAFVKEMGIPV